jgi:glycosyltransferase domain-containing protein
MNNFTLVVPTHNRHEYLKRSIEYFKSLNATVIYCDSSEYAYSGGIPKNIEYLHLAGENFSKKILISLDKVNTDYVALCADDDFILIESLYMGCSILNEDKRFKSVVGKYVSFNANFNGHYFPLYQNIPQDINLELEKNVALFFSNYYQILWAMYDKKLLFNAFQIIHNANFYNDNYIEMVIGSVACFNGGIKFIDVIWGVRESSNTEHWATKHATINNIKIANINGDYEKFKFQINKNTMNGYAEKVMSNYLNSHMIKKGFIKSWISKFIPNFLKFIISKFLLERNKDHFLCLNQSEINNLKPVTEILFKYNRFNVE